MVHVLICNLVSFLAELKDFKKQFNSSLREDIM